MKFTALLVCAIGLFGSVRSAQVTSSTVKVGGPGSCSSEGFNDPGRLADGVTEASATYALTLDAGAKVLTAVVTNTSKVVPGVNNPLLTDVYFNAPVQVTAMSLSSQSSAGGQQPAFALTFDADLFSNPNPNGADGMGAFCVRLQDTGNIEGAIANQDADIWVKPPAQLALGATTFVLDLTGNLAGVTASDFTGAFSKTPPGNKPSHAVGHFQAGGVDSVSAFISDSPEECFLVMSNQPGSSTWIGPDPTEYGFGTQLGQISEYYGVTVQAPLMIRLPERKLHLLAPQVWQQFSLQVLMWNPAFSPTNPEQYSGGMKVTIYEDGSFRVSKFGSEDGISVSTKIVRVADGRRYLSFPFTIAGL